MVKRQQEMPTVTKALSLGEIELGIRKLTRRLEGLQSINPDATKHDDPIVEQIESDIRATILETFGPYSPEYKEHQYFYVSPGPSYTDESAYEIQQNFKQGVQRAIQLIKGLIKRLEEKKEDIGYEKPRLERKTPPVAARRVFVVHGRDEDLKNSMARFLERLELDVIILGEQPNQGKTIIEKFEANADVKCAVILLSPDDVGCLGAEYTESSENLKSRARQNAILELGYFIGKLGRENVFAICKGTLELPSDLHGVIYIPFDPSGGWKLMIAKELKASGLMIDMNKAI